MLHITNKKIAGFDTRWAPFHGFSILFNNPDDHCLQQHSGTLYLANDVSNDTALYFYKLLHECLTQLNIDFLTNTFLFCPLPPSTYHVTLFGGLNHRHVSQVNSQYQAMVDDWLKGLPQSFCITPDDIFQLPAASALCTKRDWNINFRFNGLQIWNNTVLVATLRPDTDSVMIFNQLCEERRQLSQQIHQRFGVMTDTETYQPHVSLGYFANEEGARRALNYYNDWNKSFNDLLQDSILSFNNANIYGLTDMITFLKHLITDLIAFQP